LLKDRSEGPHRANAWSACRDVDRLYGAPDEPRHRGPCSGRRRSPDRRHGAPPRPGTRRRQLPPLQLPGVRPSLAKTTTGCRCARALEGFRLDPTARRSQVPTTRAHLRRSGNPPVTGR
jgi:hypothetical protein